MRFWIARDRGGTLFLYSEKPVKRDNMFVAPTGATYVIKLKEYRYPEVTFENSPKEVELKLIDDGNETLDSKR